MFILINFIYSVYRNFFDTRLFLFTQIRILKNLRHLEIFSIIFRDRMRNFKICGLHLPEFPWQHNFPLVFTFSLPLAEAARLSSSNYF